MAGDCFETAAGLVAQDPSLTLVHGIVWHADTGRHWHAWVERTVTFEMPEVGQRSYEVMIDRSNGNDVSVPTGLGYKLGRIDRDETWRYTSSEMIRAMAEHGNYGPWVDDFADLP